MKRVYRAMCRHMTGVLEHAIRLLDEEKPEEAKKLLQKAKQDAEEFAANAAAAEEAAGNAAAEESAT